MLLIILYLFAFIGVSIGGFLLVSKYVHHSKMEVHNEVAGFIYAVIGVIYAVLLAFVVVTVWDQFTDAEENVNQEVSHVVDLYRNADAFPDSVRNEIKSSCINYMNDIILYEWKEMEKFQISAEAKKSYKKLWEVHRNYVPTNSIEIIWYSESVKELNQLADARRFRINSIYYNIHPFLWFVIIFGAFITIGFSYLFGTVNKIAHIIMIFCLSGSIGLILVLINAFVHPFSGLIHVTCDSFILALEQLK